MINVTSPTPSVDLVVLGRLDADVGVARGRRDAHLVRLVLLVPVVEPLHERVLAVEAAVVQRQVLQQKEADLTARLGAFELL